MTSYSCFQQSARLFISTVYYFSVTPSTQTLNCVTIMMTIVLTHHYVYLLCILVYILVFDVLLECVMYIRTTKAQQQTQIPCTE